MNYLDLINRAWSLRKQGILSEKEHYLYLFLLDSCNGFGWQNPFFQSTQFVCGFLEINKNALTERRNSLKQAGLIDFEIGNRATAPKYTIIGIELSNFKNTQTKPKPNLNRTQTEPKQIPKIDIDKEDNSNEFELLGATYNFDLKNEFCEQKAKSGEKCQRKSCYKINGKNYCNQHARIFIIENKNKISFEKRKSEFYNECAVFVQTYRKETIRKFFDYWTEPNKSKTKMRFELEKTWDLSRRLSTWDNNEFNFNKNGKQEEKQYRKLIVTE